MSDILLINTYPETQNYSIHFPLMLPGKSNRWSSVALRPEGVSRRRRSAPRCIDTKVVSSCLIIRSFSFRGTNKGKRKRYRQEPANKALKSNSENKHFDLHFKKQIRSSKTSSIFYSKSIVIKWISSVTPPGGFEPDLNYFFLKGLKITLSTAPVGVEFESNCSKTPLNRPFSRRFPTKRPSGWFLENKPKKLRFASYRSGLWKFVP